MPELQNKNKMELKKCFLYLKIRTILERQNKNKTEFKEVFLLI